MKLLRFELSRQQKGVLIGSNVGANDGHAGRFERQHGSEKKSRGVGPRGISTSQLTSNQFLPFGVMVIGLRAHLIMGEERGF